MKAVVIGAGVAGSAVAVALSRIGADVAVVEAYPDPGGQVGSFVSLATNGLRGLDSIGCLPAVQEVGTDVARQHMRASGGRLLGDVARGRRDGDDLHSVTLMRADLVRVLRSAAAVAGAEVVTGKRFVGTTRTSDGISAVLDSGDAITADLLVGADGIWSRTRRDLDADAPEPTYAGLWSASGASPGAEVDTEPGTFTMVFARRGAFLYVPAADGTLWWSAQVAAPSPPDLDAIDLDLLRSLFADDREPARMLRAATSMHRPTLHHVLGDVKVWHDDRTVLIGDAAHPVGAGQGASLAIEDAVALARHLDGAPSVAAGLTAYEDARRDRITRMLAMARSNRDAKVAGPLKRLAQELVMPLVFHRGYARATSWLYEDPGAAAATTSSGRR